MKVSDLNKMIEETISREIKNSILNENEGKKTAYCIKCEGEYIEMCSSLEEANEKCEEYNKNNPDKKFVVETETYESEEELIDKMDALGEELDSENMEENQSMEEKLHGKQHKLDVDKDGEIEASDLAALRKGDAKESDDLDIMETTCEKCGKMICECGDMYEENSVNESKKERKVLRLTESQFVEMISKMVSESIPGVKAVEDAHKETDKETKEHMGQVDKKIKDALTIEGNDNPEFPKPIGKGEKMAVNNTEEQDEEMSMDRGEGPLDLDYDHEPSESFKQRVKKALEGDSTMGNADGGNTIKTDTGKKLADITEKRKKHKKEAPMYVKDVQPVNETVEKKKTLLEEEIEKMKKISFYNKKTQ